MRKTLRPDESVDQEEADNRQLTYDRIAQHKGELVYPQNATQTISLDAKSVIHALLNPDPSTRMTANELLMSSAWHVDI
jgi:hypothetical protein